MSSEISLWARSSLSALILILKILPILLGLFTLFVTSAHWAIDQAFEGNTTYALLVPTAWISFGIFLNLLRHFREQQ
ncbi:hypothetical protein [Marinagarivorans cellulosilyticus]|uniref:hypothetical protein n=1 Tax=Marinagarivorans cellulosilyticus TaxID=2721545 RepID=UPI001F2442CB|nr:hypothetical protein [Marinagarivorans cellulosilyticus]